MKMAEWNVAVNLGSVRPGIIVMKNISGTENVTVDQCTVVVQKCMLYTVSSRRRASYSITVTSPSRMNHYFTSPETKGRWLVAKSSIRENFRSSFSKALATVSLATQRANDSPFRKRSSNIWWSKGSVKCDHVYRHNTKEKSALDQLFLLQNNRNLGT